MEVYEKIISVNTADGERSVKSLREEINALRDSILNLDKDSEEYGKQVEKLQEDQRMLNDVMALTKKEAVALDGSYDALQHQMTLLRKQWKATNDETKRNAIGAEIAKINSQLKALDASIGNNQRNVGSYEEAMKNVFKSPRQEIQELRLQLAGLTEGTEEYNRVFTELANKTAEQRKLMENLKYASADFGDVMSTVSGVMGGIAGGFSAMNALIALSGEESGRFGEVMIKLQASMALVQGIQGLEGLRDKFDGLIQVFKNVIDRSKIFSVNIGAIQGNTANASAGAASLAGSLENVGQASVNAGESISEVAESLNTINGKIAESVEEVIWLANREEEVKNAQESLNQALKDGEITLSEYEAEMSKLNYLLEEITGRQKELAEETANLYNDYDKLKRGQSESGKAIKEASDATDELSENSKEAAESTKKASAENTKYATTTKVASTATKAFTFTLKALKAALISTGIGALLVLLGKGVEILGKWLGHLIGYIDGTNKAKKATDDLAAANEALNHTIETINEQMDFESRVLDAQGASYDEIIAKKKEYIKAEIAETEALLANQEAFFNSLSKRKQESKKYKEYREELEKTRKTLEDLKKQYLKLEQDEYINGIKEETEARRKAKEAAVRYYAEVKKAAEEARKKELDNRKQIIANAQAIVDALKKANRTEIEEIKYKYDTERDLLNKAQEVELIQIEEQYNSRLITDEEYEKAKQKIRDKYANINRLHLKKEDEDTRKVMGKWAKELAETEISGRGESTDRGVRKIEYEYSLKQAENGTLTFEELAEKAQRLYDLRRQQLENEADVWEGVMNDRTIDLETAELAQKKYVDAINALNDLETQNTIDNADLRRKALEAEKNAVLEQVKVWTDFASSLGSILDSVASAWETALNAQVESGEKSEETARKEFENIKALQYATTWINTLASMTSVLADPTAGPWFVRIAQAAAAFATGMANTIQIKNTQFGSVSSASASGAIVTPTITEKPNYSYTRNLTTAEEEDRLNEPIRAFVVESDISNALNKAKIRVAESSF